MLRLWGFVCIEYFSQTPQIERNPFNGIRGGLDTWKAEINDIGRRLIRMPLRNDMNTSNSGINYCSFAQSLLLLSPHSMIYGEGKIFAAK